MMCKLLYILFILALLGCSSSVAQAPRPELSATKMAQVQKPMSEAPANFYNEVNWLDWDDVSLLRAKLKRRPLAIFFYADDCGPCSMMETTTFQDPEVIQTLNKDFVPVRARGEDFPNEIDTLFGKHNYPALAFLTPDGVLIAAVNGYVPPSNYKHALNLIVKANAN